MTPSRTDMSFLQPSRLDLKPTAKQCRIENPVRKIDKTKKYYICLLD
jgi:hypothetical protein